MIDLVRALAEVPIPLVLILVVGVLLWRWPALSRLLITTATIALLALCLPVTGRLLQAPLIAAAPVFVSSGAIQDAAILVPTGGIYADATGVWWPSSTSIVRAVSGHELSTVTGLPLVMIGGSPRGEAESEAMVVARAVDLVGPDNKPRPGIFLETAARNSSETAAAAKPLLDRLGATHVILVTSPTHVARMAASLRHLGYRVSVHLARGTPTPIQPLGAAEPFIPSAAGLSLSAGAIHEYLGLLWYLLEGHVTVTDLRSRVLAGPTGEAQ